jgi:hypothetical protein
MNTEIEYGPRSSATVHVSPDDEDHYLVRALRSVLADRERELLELKGPCSNTPAGCTTPTAGRARPPRRADPMIVIVTPTIMDGTVVRWYATEHAAVERDEAITASRNGIRVPGDLADIPDAVIRAAVGAHVVLRDDEDIDLSHLATHRRRGMFGPLEPVERSTEEKTDVPEVSDVPT